MCGAQGSCQMAKLRAFFLLCGLCSMVPLHSACPLGSVGCVVVSSPCGLMPGPQPTGCPPRILLSAGSTVTQTAWLLHTESWAGSWKTHDPLCGNHGISPGTCLWQLQGHRKVIAGEMPRELEEAEPCPHCLEPLPRGQESSAPALAGSTWAAGGSRLTHLTLDSTILSRCSQPWLCNRTPGAQAAPRVTASGPVGWDQGGHQCL